MEQFHLSSLISGQQLSKALNQQEGTAPQSKPPLSPSRPSETQMNLWLDQKKLSAGSNASGGQPAATTPVSRETRDQISKLMMGGGLRKELSSQLPRSLLSPTPSYAPLPAQLPTLVPVFIALVAQVRQELEAQLPKLLSLNPGRREAIAQYLDRLSGSAPGPALSTGAADAAAGLRRWLDPVKNAAQTRALKIYLEEVALIALGQAILLKAWSDRGLRPFPEEDLGRLNWALSCALKPHIPLDREAWQITKPNLYSWYNPSPGLQKDVWNALQSWRITDEDPSVLSSLLRTARQYAPQTPEYKGYDTRFFSSVWTELPAFGFDPMTSLQGPMKRRSTVFCPTLRDGTVVRTGSTQVSWVGLESVPFQLFLAELVQLWWGPSCPPLWANGSGLEVHTRDQLTLALGSPKPTLYARIAEMEACDLAWVFEERTIRLGTRTPEAQTARAQIDQIPFFKNLKGQGVSLGDLQACISLSKLRPGALLWWTREEPLTSEDGSGVLSFLLDRSRILCEWDFSGVEHSLPTQAPLFPKHLYLLARDSDLQSRLSHRPRRIVLQGQIRSHIEVPLFLQDAIQSYHRPTTAQQPRGQWQIHLHQSPSSQKEWAERWPDPTAQETIRSLEELRSQSLPLASFSTVRATPAGDPDRGHAWSLKHGVHGIWVRGESTPEGRRLWVEEIPAPGVEAKGQGFLVLTPNHEVIAPLKAYLRSAPVQTWLEHHAERKGDRWLLNEQIIKFIPIPSLILEAMGVSPDPRSPNASAFAIPLPGDWERWASELLFHPQKVGDKLGELPFDEEGKRIRASLFVRSARSIDQVEREQGRLLSLVQPDGAIRWKELLDILPPTELTPVTLSEYLKVSGSLPLHLPIARWEKIKAAQPTLLFSTESGFHLRLVAQSLWVLDLVWEQLQGLAHPTWNELVAYLRVPKRLEVAEEMASDILRSHAEQSGRIQALQAVLARCLG